jgi:hypothetical protein
LLKVKYIIHDRYKVFSFVFIKGSVSGVPPPSTSQFQNNKIAVSFAAQDSREVVEDVVTLLKKDEQLNGHIFYDDWHTVDLAIADLDIKLYNIYTQAELVVVFLSKNYCERPWCNIEWRTIKERLYSTDPNIKATLILVKHGKFAEEQVGSHLP